MTKVALRGLRQRKLRAFVTMLAVLLGVAFIAGSYVLTDTINRSFDDIFDVAYEGTDVAVSSSTTGQTDGGDVPAFPERYLDEVRQVDGVEKAAGGIFSPLERTIISLRRPVMAMWPVGVMLARSPLCSQPSQ